jgi:hypothetical protein
MDEGLKELLANLTVIFQRITDDWGSSLTDLQELWGTLALIEKELLFSHSGPQEVSQEKRTKALAQSLVIRQDTTRLVQLPRPTGIDGVRQSLQKLFWILEC